VHDQALLPESLVRPSLVARGDVLGEHPAQGRLVGGEQVVEALGAGRPDPALREGVGGRRAARRAHDRHL
jgi:hypothetical protein